MNVADVERAIHGEFTYEWMVDENQKRVGVEVLVASGRDFDELQARMGRPDTTRFEVCEPTAADEWAREVLLLGWKVET